ASLRLVLVRVRVPAAHVDERALVVDRERAEEPVLDRQLDRAALEAVERDFDLLARRFGLLVVLLPVAVALLVAFVLLVAVALLLVVVLLARLLVALRQERRD